MLMQPQPTEFTTSDRETLEAIRLHLNEPDRPVHQDELRFIGPPEAVAELLGALAKARAEFPPIPQNCSATVRGTTADGKPYSYEFAYADLGSIVRATAPALSHYGLALFYPLTNDDVGFRVRVILAHSSGARLEADIRFSPVMGKFGPDDQKTAGRVTYWTRYGVRGVLGIAAESDDDGNLAAGNEAVIARRDKPEPTKVTKPAQKPQDKPARAETPTDPAPAQKPTTVPPPPPEHEFAPDDPERPATQAEIEELWEVCKRHGLAGPAVAAMGRKLHAEFPRAMKAAGGAKLRADLLKDIAAVPPPGAA